MATVYQQLSLKEAEPDATTYPQWKVVAATAGRYGVWSFAAATDDALYFSFFATLYGSGNVTVRLHWYADTATSGDTVWDAAIAAITPNTDTQDWETKALATVNSVTDSHLTTTGQRLHQCEITVSNLDSLAADDEVRMRLRRVGSSGSDTMTGTAELTGVRLAYSDT